MLVGHPQGNLIARSTVFALFDVLSLPGSIISHKLLRLRNQGGDMVLPDFILPHEKDSLQLFMDKKMRDYQHCVVRSFLSFQFLQWEEPEGDMQFQHCGSLLTNPPLQSSSLGTAGNLWGSISGILVVMENGVGACNSQHLDLGTLSSSLQSPSSSLTSTLLTCKTSLTRGTISWLCLTRKNTWKL